MRDSKITFRVSDDLIERVDRIDESRSEIMRRALRDYLDSCSRPRETRNTSESLDSLISQRVEEIIDEKLRDTDAFTSQTDPNPESQSRAQSDRLSDIDAVSSCSQCGESLDDDCVYCPNCGTKVSRVFCECGDEVRSDWRFCPSCGRRTSPAQSPESK
ncbi:MAG: zinc-ribbon domain-containing protein [Halobacteria archaeon]|nr:zinc-ribbon domain-containing protein [Halobacteria archaeon]